MHIETNCLAKKRKSTRSVQERQTLIIKVQTWWNLCIQRHSAWNSWEYSLAPKLKDTVTKKVRGEAEPPVLQPCLYSHPPKHPIILSVKTWQLKMTPDAHCTRETYGDSTRPRQRFCDRKWPVHVSITATSTMCGDSRSCYLRRKGNTTLKNGHRVSLSSARPSIWHCLCFYMQFIVLLCRQVCRKALPTSATNAQHSTFIFTDLSTNVTVRASWESQSF